MIFAFRSPIIFAVNRVATSRIQANASYVGPSLCATQTDSSSVNSDPVRIPLVGWDADGISHDRGGILMGYPTIRDGIDPIEIMGSNGIAFAKSFRFVDRAIFAESNFSVSVPTVN